jgi:uncharacterized repeat protein (TIGR01451 family)
MIPRFAALCVLVSVGVTPAFALNTSSSPIPRVAPPKATAKVTVPLAARTGSTKRVSLMIELADAPAAQDWAAAMADRSVSRDVALAQAKRAAQSKIALLGPQQDRLSVRLSADPINAQELFRLKRVMNAVAVRVESGRIGAIAALPGVKRVRIITPEFPVNAVSVPFIGAPQVWANRLHLPGRTTGTGMRVGIIDTGLDYQHPTFGGTGALADYEANDRVTIHPGLFPTAKVVGGFDFAGDDYDGTNSPVPDPNPTDCNNHGSHVAGTAAGFGVTADGKTYRGPYGPAAPFNALRIGPGVAPGASLYAIRVFGCGGGTDLVTEGIEFAVDPNGDGDFSDHLDVINMSLGSAYGGLADTSAQAAEAAAQIGVVVVAAQGNDGDTYFIGGSPASATSAIAVAASIDPSVPGAALLVNAPPSIAGTYSAAAGDFGATTPAPAGQTGNLVEVQSATGTADEGCDATYTNAAAISGNIALISRGSCSFQAKIANAQAAGAIGAVVFNNVDGDPTVLSMGTDGTSPAITIASLFVTTETGQLLAATAGVNVTLEAANSADTVASFSSRGPRGGATFPIRLKPDVSAPGLAIPSTQSGMTCEKDSEGCIVPADGGIIPGGQVLVLSGTSMSTPHITGTMALLRQLHPDWSVEELKAALMNGALHDLSLGSNGSGGLYGLGRVGAGRVDVALSAQATVTAMSDDDQGAITVGFDSAVVGSTTQVKTLRVVNHGSQPQTFKLAFDARTIAPGVTFSLVDPSQATLTVPANSSVTVGVQMSGQSSKMDHTSDPTISLAQTAPAPFDSLGSQPRHYLTEAGSYLNFNQGAKTTLRVPVYSAPVPASRMAGASPIETAGASSGTSAISLNGVGVCSGSVSGGQCNGNFPLTEASLVTPFELQVAQPLNPFIPGFANIQYVGVAYDKADDLLLFGVSTWGPWSTPADVAFNIYVDTQNNGTFDKIIFNSDPGNISSNLFGNQVSGQDVPVSAVFDFASEQVGTEDFLNLVPANVVDTRVFGNNVMILAVSPKDLGFAGSKFRYRVETCPGFAPLCSPFFGFNYDSANGPFTWDLSAPGLDFDGNALAFDLAGGLIPVAFDHGHFVANNSLGALLLHSHNTNGTQAQAIPLEGDASADLAVTTSVSPATIPSTNHSPVTLTIKVKNAGPDVAKNVSIFDGLPAGLTWVSDDGKGSFDPVSDLWTVGSLGVGQSATLHLLTSVAASGEIVNTAQVASTTPLDPNPANDVSTVTFNAPRLADLGVKVAATASSVVVGGSDTFTVTLRNFGGDAAYSPKVHLAITGASGVASAISATGGSFDPATGMWQLGSLGAGKAESLTFKATAKRTGSLIVLATATSSTPDPNTHNNQSSVAVTIH